jgi:uncharacterized membrane protein
MAIIGRLHPLLVHFPIALVLSAAVAETAAAITSDDGWHQVAIGNVRIAAAFGVLAAIAGWRLALDSVVETSLLLEWHRWLGAAAAGVTLIAAATASRASRWYSPSPWVFRIALITARALVAATGHLGGVLVWGTGFLRP